MIVCVAGASYCNRHATTVGRNQSPALSLFSKGGPDEWLRPSSGLIRFEGLLQEKHRNKDSRGNFPIDAFGLQKMRTGIL